MRSERNWHRAELHYNSGNLDAARVVCESLLGVTPGHPAAHWMLSSIHQGRGRFRTAVDHARRAATECGRLPLAQRLAITHQLASVGDYREALRLLDSIAPSGSIEPLLFAEIVEQLARLDAHARAAEWLALAAGNARFHCAQLAFLRGNNKKFLGDFGGAASAYEEAIALSPRDAHAHHALAGLHLKEGTAMRIDRLRRLAGTLDQTRQPNDLTAALYALFKELDAVGDPDAAWKALDSALRSRHRLNRHDSSAENRAFDHLVGSRWPHRVPGACEGDASPIFIIGMPRTGTTLVEQMLANHPDIAACGELSDLRMRYKWASDYYCSGFLDVEAASRMGKVNPAELGLDYLRNTSWRAGGRRWYTDKHPGNFVFTALIMSAIPDARIIHVRRDAMDTCFSNLKELFAPHYYEYSYAIESVANHYRNYSRWMAHATSFGNGRLIEVAYEDLVQQPEEQAARLMNFLGVAAVPASASACRGERPVSTASSVQVRSPIHTQGIGGWKRYARYLGPLEDQLGMRGQT